MAADDKLFRVYQYWVHQNPGTHLDDGIEEDGKWQHICKKLISLPTQRYDVPSGWVEKQFVTTLMVDLDKILNQQWNAESVIVFQTIILQRVHLLSGAINICEWIN